MKNKDMIFRVSASNKDASDFLDTLQIEAAKIGLAPTDKSIRQVPEKIRKQDIQDKKAKDVKISVSGSESKVEEFMQLVALEAEKQLSLVSSSVNLKLKSSEDDEKK